MRISDWSSDVCSSDLQGEEADRRLIDADLGQPIGQGGEREQQRQAAREAHEENDDDPAVAIDREGTQPVAARPCCRPRRLYVYIFSRHPSGGFPSCAHAGRRSEEHTSELQSLMRISYAVLCLEKQSHTRG